ncbi:Tyrosine-protein kinase [Aphelenchoides besseyi]|nr:Tyrosine-protein kinase [Aphelenchoides besseyi]
MFHPILPLGQNAAVIMFYLAFFAIMNLDLSIVWSLFYRFSQRWDWNETQIQFLNSNPDLAAYVNSPMICYKNVENFRLFELYVSIIFLVFFFVGNFLHGVLIHLTQKSRNSLLTSTYRMHMMLLTAISVQMIIGYMLLLLPVVVQGFLIYYELLVIPHFNANYDGYKRADHPRGLFTFGSSSTKAVFGSQSSAMVDKQLAEEQYYHGLLPREDIKEMLRSNGDFLVRSTEPVAGQPRAFVLSIMVQQEKDDLGYSIERWSFNSIPEMINHHLHKGDSVSKTNDQVILRNPILRQSWELSHDDVESTKKLGEGAFGEVHKGKLRLKNGQKVDVAIKMAKLEVLTKDQIKEIMREFYGVGAGQEPLLVVMELVECGALDSYLQKEELIPQKKMELCTGAAWGLEYLHTKNVLHRDIAARNCLISDFGLTREGTMYKMDPHRRVPIRWLAQETLTQAIYTQKTDVCWEIFSNGIEPYPGMTVAEVSMKVREGYRMPLPSCTPMEMHNIVQRCWAADPTERMTMAEVAHQLEIITGLPRPRSGTPVSMAASDNRLKKAKKEKLRAKKTALG